MLELGRGLSRPAGQQGVDLLGPELVCQHHRQGPLPLQQVGGSLSHNIGVAPDAQVVVLALEKDPQRSPKTSRNGLIVSAGLPATSQQAPARVPVLRATMLR